MSALSDVLGTAEQRENTAADIGAALVALYGGEAAAEGTPAAPAEDAESWIDDPAVVAGAVVGLVVLVLVIVLVARR